MTGTASIFPIKEVNFVHLQLRFVIFIIMTQVPMRLAGAKMLNLIINFVHNFTLLLSQGIVFGK